VSLGASQSFARVFWSQAKGVEERASFLKFLGRPSPSKVLDAIDKARALRE
jgi:hypothetical protein